MPLPRLSLELSTEEAALLTVEAGAGIAAPRMRWCMDTEPFQEPRSAHCSYFGFLPISLDGAARNDHARHPHMVGNSAMPGTLCIGAIWKPTPWPCRTTFTACTCSRFLR